MIGQRRVYFAFAGTFAEAQAKSMRSTARILLVKLGEEERKRRYDFCKSYASV